MKKPNTRSGNEVLEYQAALLDGIADSKSKYRKVVQAGISKWITDFQKGQIAISTVDDLKKLIELDLALQRDEL